MDNMHKQMGSNFSRNYKKESSGDATRKKKKDMYIYQKRSQKWRHLQMSSRVKTALLRNVSDLPRIMDTTPTYHQQKKNTNR